MMILSWCPGTACDPCFKVSPVIGNVSVVGTGFPPQQPYSQRPIGTNGKIYGYVGIEWTDWSSTLWTTVTASVVITVSGVDAKMQPVTGSITISGSALF